MDEGALAGEHGKLRILPPDAVIRLLLQGAHAEAAPRRDPRIELALRVEELQELLGQVLVLRELPEPQPMVVGGVVPPPRPRQAGKVIELLCGGKLVPDRRQVDAGG